MTDAGGQRSPLILGHRGASASHVENSLPAFAAALSGGADGVELDVHLCASGEAVVFHDADLRRLVGRSERIEDLSYSEIAAIRLSDGSEVPTLDSVLECVGGLINIEIKTTSIPVLRRLCDAVLGSVARAGAASRIIISSFNPLVLLWFRRKAPFLRCGHLFHREQRPIWQKARTARWLGAKLVHPQVSLVNEDSVRQWQAAGLGICVWTVDDVGVAQTLRDWGVDIIISNDPGHLVRGLGG